MYEINNEAELKLYIIESLSFNRLNKKDYLYNEFYRDYPNMIDDIIDNSPLKANVPIEVIVQKAKEMIKFEIEGGLSIPLRMEPNDLNIMYNAPNYFIQHSLKIMQKLSYLFNTPFFSTYINIKDDDITMIFLYFAIMFKDSFYIKVFREIIEDDKTVSSILNSQEKLNLEKKVFNYIQKYTNTKIMPLFETIINNRGRAFSNLANRLLNTFIKYYNY